MLTSIRNLASITGKGRDLVAAAIQHLPSCPGPKGAKLYDSADALRAIYCGPLRAESSLEDARIRLANEQASLTKTRNETLRKERVPIAITAAIWDSALQSFAAILKAARGQTLTTAKINELLGKLRDAKLPVKWEP